LVGEDLDIRTLSSSLRGTGWQILKEGDSNYLVSDILDALSDAKEIKSKADQLLDTSNGVANVIHVNHVPVRSGNVYLINSAGTYDIAIIFDTIKSRSRVSEVILSLNGVAQKTYSQQLLDLAELDAAVRDALHFFNENTWWNLYKVYEIVRADVGGSKRLHRLMSKSKLDPFTHTAQSRDAIGDLARHADPSIKAPARPLTLDQASLLVRNLFKEWVSRKIAQHRLATTRA